VAESAAAGDCDEPGAGAASETPAARSAAWLARKWMGDICENLASGGVAVREGGIV
jgi:hypothetical protein